MAMWEGPEDNPPTQHKPAAICRRGHMVTRDMTRMADLPRRCPECGAEVLTACPDCGHRILGYDEYPDVTHTRYERPSFCDECGAPFPWVGRRQRLYELENVMEQEPDLDEATKLWLREQIAVLQEIDPMDAKAQTEAWRQIKDYGHALWNNPAAQKIIGTLISEAVKRAIK